MTDRPPLCNLEPGGINFIKEGEEMTYGPQAGFGWASPIITFGCKAVDNGPTIRALEAADTRTKRDAVLARLKAEEDARARAAWSRFWLQVAGLAIAIGLLGWGLAELLS